MEDSHQHITSFPLKSIQSLLLLLTVGYHGYHSQMVGLCMNLFMSANSYWIRMFCFFSTVQQSKHYLLTGQSKKCRFYLSFSRGSRASHLMKPGSDPEMTSSTFTSCSGDCKWVLRSHLLHPGKSLTIC